MNHITDLCAFLDAAPTNFHAVDATRRHLEEHGFRCLDMTDRWTLRPGDRRYVLQNGSAIFAFVVGNGDPAAGYHIIAAHSDSPGFRIKPSPEMPCEGGAVKLNTEVYGGPILYTWFDRALSIAGRVALRSDNPLRPALHLVDMKRPLLTIPHLAIHFNRAVNDGNPLSRQKDMLPVIALQCHNPKGLVRTLIAEQLDVDPDTILDYDLSLYDTERAGVLGLENEMMASGRIDDLSMVHASVTALCDKADTAATATRVVAIFDNEETGSGTKQGAASPILDHILRRVCICMGGDESDYLRAVADSYMISADNAHGLHPNYVEKQDPTNHPVLGGGPCVKINANCKYMTDADSAAVFRALCQDAGVPCQYFVNHSDVAGGSTLGNILTSQLPLRGVDMGAPLWAMHSVRETASTADHIATIRVFSHFFGI